MVKAAKERAKAAKEDFVLCIECSDAEGKDVLVHMRHVSHEEGLFSEGSYQCPEGHEVELSKEQKAKVDREEEE